MQAGQGRRSFKRLVQPGLQLAVKKGLLAQQSHQIRQRSAIASPQLQVFQQQHRDECCPNLDVQRVGAGAHEGFDAQVLLQIAEQLSDILPINSALLKLQFTIASILCVRTACRWSGCTNSTTKPAMSCGTPTADRWRCRSG